MPREEGMEAIELGLCGDQGFVLTLLGISGGISKKRSPKRGD